MRRLSRARRLSARPAAFAALAVLVHSVAACASLPREGPVQAGERRVAPAAVAPFEFNPQGPRPGAAPDEIVSGFLNAMQATPVGTRVAVDFLTRAAAEEWQPARRTLVYTSSQLEAGDGSVRVRLTGTAELDGRGRWLGSRGRSTRTMELRVTRESGEWRVSDPPDAMVVPQSHFASRYQQYSLYFLDPTGSVVVPEPVFVPDGVQAPTLLVSSLLQGPAPGARAVVRSAFPADTRLGVSVPVTDGVAEVPLTAPALELQEGELDAALAQLAWTLGQVPEVERLRVLVDGTPVELPGGGDSVSVSGWSGYSPAIAAASTDVFGIRSDRVQQVVGDSEITALELGNLLDLYGRPRALGVNMTGQRFAVVAADRRRTFVLDRSEEGSHPRLTYPGSSFLRPLWDLTDRLWLVDRTASGAVVSVAGRRAVRQIEAPGVTGREVVAAALSRDGSRLAVLRRAGSRQELVLARVVRTSRGVPVRVTAARRLPTPEPMRRALSLGWRDPTTVALLTRPSPLTTEILLARSDGSSAFVPATTPLGVLFDRGRSLVASPGGPTALLVAARGGRLHELDPQGRWDLDVVEAGLLTPTFVG